jgi:hypothetical protein
MGPRPKIATVERREGSRSHRDAVVAPRKRDKLKSAPVGAPPAPHQGSGRPLSPR